MNMFVYTYITAKRKRKYLEKYGIIEESIVL